MMSLGGVELRGVGAWIGQGETRRFEGQVAAFGEISAD